MTGLRSMHPAAGAIPAKHSKTYYKYNTAHFSGQ